MSLIEQISDVSATSDSSGQNDAADRHIVQISILKRRDHVRAASRADLPDLNLGS
jgi:hypothetical protein